MRKGVCSTCNRTKSLRCRDMCSGCYNRWRETLTPEEVKAYGFDFCKVDGCNKGASSVGYCKNCHQKWKTFLTGEEVTAHGYQFCKTAGCDRCAVSKGMCARCFDKSKRGKNTRGSKVPSCSVDGCHNKSYRDGLCYHHMRYLKDPDYFHNKSRKRRAMKRNAMTDDTAKKFQHSDRCAYCGIEVSTEADPYSDNKANVEHKQPIARGGSHTLDNLVTSCRVCNSSKSDKTLQEFTVERLGWEVDEIFGPIILIKDEIEPITQTYVDDLWIQVAMKAIREERV